MTMIAFTPTRGGRISDGGRVIADPFRQVRRLASLGLGLTFLASIPVVSGEEASPAPHPETDATAAAVQLPPLNVQEKGHARFLGPTPDVVPARLSSNEPLRVVYPGSAYASGISKGAATVGVMLDETGKPVDFLILAYTHPDFGDALLKHVRTLKFTPLQARGVSTASRYLLNHVFYPDENVQLILNVSEAVNRKLSEFKGGLTYTYRAHKPSELDRPLELVGAAQPLFPEGYAAPKDGKVELPVSFFVDESGALRLPNVDATPSPLLVRNAIRALEQWKFKPPLLAGNPVLVRGRGVLTFEPPSL